MSGQEQTLTWGQVSDGPVGLAALELWLRYLVFLIHTRGMVMMRKLVVACVAGILAAGMGASASGRAIFVDPAAAGGGDVPADLLALDSRVTDCNAAFFDVANDFHGCIAGCHEILRRQGLVEGIWCLDPEEGLSPGQAAELDRVCRMHADLSDDAFVAENLERWLS